MALTFHFPLNEPDFIRNILFKGPKVAKFKELQNYGALFTWSEQQNLSNFFIIIQF